MFVHLCVHGVAWNQVPSLRWVADAHAVLAKSEAETDSGPINWNKIVGIVKQRQMVLSLLVALTYLKTLFPDQIPDEAIAELAVVGLAGQELAELAVVDLAAVEFGQSRSLRPRVACAHSCRVRRPGARRGRRRRQWSTSPPRWIL